jgi:tetratricopeptide (TPR) repeat protein
MIKTAFRASVIASLILFILVQESPGSGGVFFFSGQIASFRPRQEAVDRVAVMKTLGHEAFYQKVNVPQKGWYFRVYLGKYANAREAYRELGRLKRQKVIDSFFVRRMKVVSLRQEERTEQPKQHFSMRDATEPVDAFHAQGTGAGARKDVPEAFFSKAGEEKSADFYYILGIAAEMKGDGDAALEHYTHAIERNPDYAAAYNKRGLIRLHRGQFDLAVEDHSRAIAINPENAEYHFNRGIDYRMSGTSNPAIADFQNACQSGSKQACSALRRIAGR